MIEICSLNSQYLSGILLSMLTKSDLNKIEKIVETKIDPIKEDLKIVKSDISKIRKDIDVIIALFDREYINLRKRVEKIEERLGLSNAT